MNGQSWSWERYGFLAASITDMVTDYRAFAESAKLQRLPVHDYHHSLLKLPYCMSEPDYGSFLPVNLNANALKTLG